MYVVQMDGPQCLSLGSLGPWKELYMGTDLQPSCRIELVDVEIRLSKILLINVLVLCPLPLHPPQDDIKAVCPGLKYFQSNSSASIKLAPYLK